MYNLLKYYVRDNPQQYAWLSLSPVVTMHDVEANPSSNWEWSFLSQNTSVDIHDIKRHYDATIPDTRQWHWYWLSRRANISLQDVLNSPELPWDWTGLAQNLPISEILLCPDILWQPQLTKWIGLSMHHKLKIEHLVKYRDKPWRWGFVSFYANITMQDVLDHPELPWDSSELSKNYNITADDITNHHEIFGDDLDWHYLTGVENGTVDDLTAETCVWKSRNDRYRINKIIHSLRIQLKTYLHKWRLTKQRRVALRTIGRFIMTVGVAPGGAFYRVAKRSFERHWVANSSLP
jgi:hypothetical protein